MTTMHRLRDSLARLDCLLSDPGLPPDMVSEIDGFIREIVHTIADCDNRWDHWRRQCERAQQTIGLMQEVIASDHELIEKQREQIAGLKALVELLQRLPLVYATEVWRN